MRLSDQDAIIQVDRTRRCRWAKGEARLIQYVNGYQSTWDLPYVAENDQNRANGKISCYIYWHDRSTSETYLGLLHSPRLSFSFFLTSLTLSHLTDSQMTPLQNQDMDFGISNLFFEPRKIDNSCNRPRHSLQCLGSSRLIV